MLNATLGALQSGDELEFPTNSTFYLVGGIIASNLMNNVIHFEGTLIFTNNIDTWPRHANGHVLECMQFNSIQNVTFTSKSIGVLDGSGEEWWGLIGYIEYGENRPRLLTIADSKNILIERLLFKNSPYWTVWIYNVNGLEIRFSEISNRRSDYDGHDIYNLRYHDTYFIFLSAFVIQGSTNQIYVIQAGLLNSLHYTNSCPSNFDQRVQY